MYIIEITTNDDRETLLKQETAATWQEANRIIDDMQDLDFDNIFIKLYKETDGDDLEYCGDFTEVKKGQLLPGTKKKSNNNLIVAGAGLLLFPIMVINRLVKK